MLRTFSKHFHAEPKKCVIFFATVQGGSSVLNLLSLAHYRGSKVYRVLKHEFQVVQEQKKMLVLQLSQGSFYRLEVIMWFEKVRAGSMRLNHPELVHKHPAHLVSSVKI